MNIRIAISSDIPVLKTLFRETILTVNRNDYTQEETADWASCGDNDSRWNELLNNLHFIVAERERYGIVGFASVSDTGYLHSMFVHKDFQHQGVATRLCHEIEKHIIICGLSEVTTEASVTARPFFEKQNFTTDKEQKRKANKLCLTNYQMSKQLK